MRNVFFIFSFLFSILASAKDIDCSTIIATSFKDSRPNLIELPQKVRVLKAVRQTFKTLRDDPEVLPPLQRALNIKFLVKSIGFEKSAAEAVYYMLGGKNSGLVLMKSENPDLKGKWKTHWWLHDVENKSAIDPTSDLFDAYYNTLPPYSYSAYSPYANTKRSSKVSELGKPSAAAQKIIVEANKILNAQGLKPNGRAIYHK
ncbi:MAG: hypothetical protein IPM57_08500 [Oligoflexia bacterium]|nr:hypothetical protein [Oligoflexia bacterium]